MIANLLDELEPMIAAISAEFGRRHRVHGADNADFAQELCIWVIENEAQVSEWLNPELYSPDHGSRMLAAALRNQSKDYAVDIKAQAVGYKRDDLTWYTEKEVEHLLPAVFDPEKWHEPPQSEGRSTKAPSEGGGWIATLADIAQAYERLGIADKDLLAGFHKSGWTNKMMAEAAEVSEALMSYRHKAAIRRLVKLLGGPRPKMREGQARDPWRGRHALTNSTARHITKGSYDDE